MDPSSSRYFHECYAVLHRLAGGFMQAQPAGHTLQPTALVSEAWMRMSGSEDRVFESTQQFLGFAARAMRSVLVDHARAKARVRRGHGLTRQDATTATTTRDLNRLVQIIDVDEALTDLEGMGRRSARAAQVVELRYFFGFTLDEVAEALGESKSTVKRHWDFARVWLRERLR